MRQSIPQFYGLACCLAHFEGGDGVKVLPTRSHDEPHFNGFYDAVGADLVGTATSLTLTIAAPPTGVVVMGIGINLLVQDVFGRELITMTRR